MKQGFTLIQLLMAIAAVLILVAGMTALFGRGIQVGSQSFVRVLTTEDARLALERISDTLRNSRNGELSFWLVDAQGEEVTVLTNTDGTVENERIRFFLEDSELKRERSKEDGSEAEVTILTRRVRNSEEDPIFRYYDVSGQEVPATEATAVNIKRVRLSLVVDENLAALPPPERIETIVIPRGTVNRTALPQVDLWPTRLNFPSPGTELTNSVIEVTMTNPINPTDQLVEYVTVQDMNEQHRLSTFDDGHEVHVNYQGITHEGYSPGWYAWIGPVVVGRSGEETYVVRDKVSLPTLCAALSPGLDLEEAHEDANCPLRTVGIGQLINRYRPILTYRLGDGTLHYVNQIEFTN